MCSKKVSRIIFHVDVNSAFLSWEAAYRVKCLGEKLDLREIPSAICGDIKKRHGIILAKSTPAKKYNIKTAETISEAVKKCPNLVLIQPHYDLYEASSKALMEILRTYSPEVEQYSIDEAYMDMTGMNALWGTPVIAANLIKNKIYKELGFTVNVGISSNKLLAKMASDFKKPNQVHTLFPDEIETKMWPLQTGDLFFCGRATENKLKKLGILTIGELANTDIQLLKKHLKKHGEILWCFANGIDVSIVESIAPANKGYGNSMTVPFDVCDASTAKMVLLSLCETVCMRLRKDNVKVSVIAVSIKDFELSSSRHQKTLFTATNITNEVFQAVSQVFDELWDGYTPIRQLGIHTGRVVDSNTERQLNLFDMQDYERYEKLDAAIDKIRGRYGEEAVFRASYVNARIRPLNGGISKEKLKAKGEEILYE
ncbi:DNA polymerase-4 [Lachnotalea glycerini]|uniref:DNA polymerase IV n=1 Tax=Lachnotalea glycerini TaxID=1763509 RepID=A0A255I1T9_9FIRM|nr:DNA polymerase IV [Lachnotalea glycerini]PXV91042.1 DNA polymerase-4 [Lachnotalea glycerini]RDY28460.1 DNA polymerase IV [Lachnotalea glycerini]